MLRSILLVCLLLNILPAITTLGQTVNPNFNPKIYKHGRMVSSAMQSDGKLIVAGQFIMYNGAAASGVVRLNVDGSVDNTFSVGTGPKGGVIQKICIQSDGKILFFGHFSTFNDQPYKMAVRVQANGTIDNTFTLDPSLDTQGILSPVLLTPDGSILFTRHISINSISHEDLIKIKPDGLRDNNFTVRVKGNINDIKLWMTDKILIGGTFNECNNTTVGNFVRLKADGSIDATYGTGANGTVSRILVQSTNKIFLTGSFSQFNGTTLTGSFTRLNSDGSVDPGFADVVSPGFTDVISDAADNIYVARGSYNEIVKYSANGGPSTTRFSTTSSDAIFLQNDGKLLGLGLSYAHDYAVIRLNNDFTKDNTYQSIHNPVDHGVINAMTQQTDGKVLIAGSFFSYDGNNCPGIVRLNTDLTIDATFLPNTAGMLFYDVVCQSDGKIVLRNGSSVNPIIRLNTNGTLDNTFSSSGNYTLYPIQVYNDQLYIASSFAPYLRRLNSNGSKDATFNAVVDEPISSIQVQPDGRILIAGSFKNVNGVALPNIARLMPDGSIDNTFVYTSSSHSISHIVLHSQNRILLGGQVNGVSYSYVTVDNSGKVLEDFSAPVGLVAGKVFLSKDNSLLVNQAGVLRKMIPSGKIDPKFSGLPLTEINNDYLYVLSLSPTSFLYSKMQLSTVTSLFHVAMTAMPPPPTAPILSTITSVAIGYPLLTWEDKSNDENEFIIYRAGDDDVFSIVGKVSGNITTYTDKSIQANKLYQYRVAASSDYGLNNSSIRTFQAGVITGLEYARLEKIYPNPSRGIFRLNFVNETDRTLRILDVAGKMIKEMRVSGYDIILDLSNEPEGIYFVQISQGVSMKSIKIVKN